MKKNTAIRTIHIILWSLLSVVWISTGISLLLRSAIRQAVETSSDTLVQMIDTNQIITAILFAAGTYIGEIHSLLLPSTSKNDVDRTILPIVFFFFSLLYIPTLVGYLQVNSLYIFPLALFGKIYIGSAFYSFVLLVLTGIYSVGINASKMYQHIIVTAVISLFIVSLIPVNSALYPLEYLRWTSSTLFISVISVLTALSVFTIWSVNKKESTQYSLLRSIRLTLIQIGAAGYILTPHSRINYLCIALYLAGIGLGFYRDRFSQL
ncbi:MAG: hypothetical protein PQJ47_02345 [Sphaerochaetaceae bacterium]|nr:hypothetical protein [Sphaerochaetaceae bacterium]MDC7248202.1 hypothetical protein [Sphaerochaetaceae bacterium]